MREDSFAAKQVGARIREVRLSRNMSQADVAAAARISLSHMSDIELGKKSMQLATFIRLAETLQVSADHLLRPDVPEVNLLYQNEFATVLEDCTPSEIESILKIVKELKSSLHQKKAEYEG